VGDAAVVPAGACVGDASSSSPEQAIAVTKATAMNAANNMRVCFAFCQIVIELPFSNGYL
jgi:hypothetical protein